jgi:aminopeptidase N
VVITLPLYDPNAKLGDTPASAFVESTVAHEVGHQWFYSLVGNDQLADPWLDESLTQYATWRYYLDTDGQEEADRFEEGLRSRWSAVKDEDIPVGLPVGDYKEVAYSAIVYGRGPLFVDALAERIGQAELDAFLHDYALTYRWQIATEADFKAMAEAECRCDLSDLFAAWVDPK